jgi:PIN domain nuclease of toxin-antitoxin system
VSHLLDTHALLWWLGEHERLSERAFAAIADTANHVFVSAASAWECAIKAENGRLPQARALLTNFRAIMARARFSVLALEAEDVIRAGALARVHGDPFDRALVAQALEREWILVSNERLLDDYGVRRLW